MKAIELFVGAGGMALGGSAAGLRPLAVFDWDKWACETIRENARSEIEPFRNWPVEQIDIRDYSFKAFNNKVEIVTGGPPCQPFSLGGRHRAYDDTRDLFPQAVRAVRETRPKAFVFENVKGLTRQTFVNYFEYIKLQLRFPDVERAQNDDWLDHLRQLEEVESSNTYKGLRYQVLAEVLNAADFGVPQRRERVFFVGIRSDLNAKWHFPKATHSRHALAWDKWETDAYWERARVSLKERELIKFKRASALQDPGEKKPWRTVREALLDLPDPQLEPKASKRFLNHDFQHGARSYKGHTGSPLDEPAKTLKAGVHGVPGGENMLRRPDGTVRYFSIRECARLQRFPDEMELHGSWSECMRQLGNAVPVDLAQKVIESVVAAIKRTS
ncbi:DNA (cytosine-5-)-methyltransferase [Sphingopyxis sp. BSNA05]|nr:DNA (cytosine-5-)-methyltransferase [Sphingopyxis sp. BSNA05]